MAQHHPGHGEAPGVLLVATFPHLMPLMQSREPLDVGLLSSKVVFL